MEAITIRKKINSINLHIEELEKYIGMETEIIILPIKKKKNTSKKEILALAGSIKLEHAPLSFQRKIRKEWDR